MNDHYRNRHIQYLLLPLGREDKIAAIELLLVFHEYEFYDKEQHVEEEQRQNIKRNEEMTCNACSLAICQVLFKYWHWEEVFCARTEKKTMLAFRSLLEAMSEGAPRPGESANEAPLFLPDFGAARKEEKMMDARK